MRTIEFEGISNVRDLGSIPIAGGCVVKSGLMYRGAALYGATDADITRLKDELKLKKVVDLRVGYEVEAKPDPVVPGVEPLYIPYYDNEVVGCEYFKPVPGTITIGKDFACDPEDFYSDMANELTARQIGKLLHTIFEAALAGEPVYYHCSGGKDRAGITSLMILQILGANEADILEDYLLTNESRQAGIDKIYQRFVRLCQGDEEMAQQITDNHCARPENLIAFRESVDARYGSMDAFIHGILGFSDEEIERYREALTTAV